MALQTLKQAFTCDVSPVLAMSRLRAGGAIDPVGTYRASRVPRIESALAGGAGRLTTRPRPGRLVTQIVAVFCFKEALMRSSVLSISGDRQRFRALRSGGLLTTRHGDRAAQESAAPSAAAWSTPRAASFPA